MDGYERLKALSERMKREVEGGAAPDSEDLTVRELLSWFGYRRRGSRKVGRIRHVLAELDLRTVPDFERAWVDMTISITLDPDAVEGIAASDESIDPTVRIGEIDAANRTPTSIDPNASLSGATTLMLMNDFSQLPVMQNERDVKGDHQLEVHRNQTVTGPRMPTRPRMHGPHCSGSRNWGASLLRH